MSIVLHGFGLDIDSTSSIVAFGLTRDLDAGESIESAIASADVSQLFVIDFGMGSRKPTAAEIRRFRRVSALISTRGLQFKERKGRKPGQIEFDVFSATILKKAA